MPDFRLTEIARTDILDLIEYGVEQFGPKVSHAYVDGLYALFDRLAQQPMIGRALAADPDARRHPYRRHVVLYEIASFGIVILSVSPMALIRDPEKLPD